MNLPLDRRRPAGTQVRIESIEFSIGARSEAELAAGFAALLFRYGGQPETQIEASRLDGSFRPLWSARLSLPASGGVMGRDLLAAAEALLGRWDGPAAALSLRATEELELRAFAGRGSLRYDAATFDRSTIERAAGHLSRLLDSVAAASETPIGAAAMLSDLELRELAGFCDGKPREKAPELVHRLFEARAAAAPGKTAVRHRDASLTYAELDARANALARLLAEKGAGPEKRVAVCIEPSLELPVALLAVLKTGAVYVPLDPTHPQARLDALMRDVGPVALLVQERNVPKFTSSPAPRLLMDDFRAAEPKPFAGTVEPGQTAYIYFTSGTTGAPKGAMASQANLAAYVASARERYEMTEADVMPAVARFTFSISMFELMAPLTCGGTLVILDRDHVIDPERLAKTLEEVTIFHIGPSLLKALTAHIKRKYSDFSPFARVRHASSGGDMIPPELLETLKEIFAKAEVFVIYGCSEIACMGCTYPVPRDRKIDRTFVGRPFDGVSVRVLDAGLNVVPAGVVGEICFSGDGVVKGYLDRPDLTAQKFVMIGGRRFYRTGDMGRVSPDGWLEILGRSDFQVKVRGIRVELGEIEHHLRRAAGVRDGVVMPMPLGLDDKALIAYVVMDGVVPEETLRKHMAEHLPEYMLPAAYVKLDALPLNHNMKVDRKALPPPEAGRRRSASEAGRAPRTESELKLAAIFARLLGLERVGLDDRFFELGGHSLLGLQLLVEIERDLGAAIKGLELVRETVEGLAALCDARLGRAAAAGAPRASELAPEAACEPLFFGSRGELYGVYSGPEKASRAVLICPPFGPDHLRSQFVLRRLAERLAGAGVPSLRFDWYGCGDSLGESLAAGPERWVRDAAEAFRELRERSGAAKVVAVSARLGATVLARAAAGLELEALVLWDPVRSGAAHLREQARAHEAFVGGWRKLFRPPAPLEGGVELLGLSLSHAALPGMRELSFPPGAGWQPPARVLESASLGRDPGWLDLSRMGEIMPDLGYSQALAKLASEGA